MPHNIIDNRDQKLVDHINSILGVASNLHSAIHPFAPPQPL
jgi:hypothetical protein